MKEIRLKPYRVVLETVMTVKTEYFISASSRKEAEKLADKLCDDLSLSVKQTKGCLEKHGEAEDLDDNDQTTVIEEIEELDE